MPFDEKMLHWGACAATRLNSIKSIETSTQHIIDVWPQYKDPSGYRLVLIYFFKIPVHILNWCILVDSIGL